MVDVPRISVLIPTFNRGQMLAGVLTSIFAQTIAASEVIVVDDGSTDETEAALEALLKDRETWRKRLVYLRQENQGKSVALNLALRRATGEWIAYDDSDDLWRPDKLEWQLRALREFPDCGVCVTDAQFVNGPSAQRTAFEGTTGIYDRRIGRIDDPVGILVNPPHGMFMQTVLVHRDIMGLAGDFDPRLRIGQDTDLLFQLGRHTRFCYVNIPLVEIDRTPERSIGLTSQFSRRSLKRLHAIELLYAKWLASMNGARADHRKAVRRLAQGIQNEISNWHLLEGAHAEARVAARRALLMRFSPRLMLKLMMLGFMPQRLKRLVRRRASMRAQSLRT